MEDDQLITRLKEEFNKVKEELNLESSYDEINNIFFIEDNTLSNGYVSAKFSRQLCSRIVDTLASWSNYLHGLVMPSPQSMVNHTESGLFDEDEKKEMMKVMNKVMALISTNNLVGLSKDKQKEKEFIDGSVKFWTEEFSSYLQTLLKKTNNYWTENSK